MITIFPPMYAEGYRPTMGDEVTGIVSQEFRYVGPRITAARNWYHRRSQRAKKEKA